jgi:hypothetical protein
MAMQSRWAVRHAYGTWVRHTQVKPRVRDRSTSKSQRDTCANRTPCPSRILLQAYKALVQVFRWATANEQGTAENDIGASAGPTTFGEVIDAT